MFANPSVVPSSSISAPGTASWSALTSGIDPPEANVTVSAPQASESASRAAATGGPAYAAAKPCPVCPASTVRGMPKGRRPSR